MPYKILVIDDRINERTYPLAALPGMLEGEGYEVATTADPEKAWDLVFEYQPDLILLDIELEPGQNPGHGEPLGITYCRQIRTEGYPGPIILITAVWTETGSVIEGFDAGADDYVRMPCDNLEILARIGASLPGGIYKVNCRILIDSEERRVWVAGVEVHFAPLEFKLLDILVRNAGRIVPSSMLIDRVWEKDVSDDVLAVFVRRLRQKIEPDPSHPTYIETVRGIGYRFRVRAACLRRGGTERRAARSRADLLLPEAPCNPTG